MKHRNWIWHQLTPTCQAEVETFLWLTSFLRIFIPGQAQHALILKQFSPKKETIELSETGKKQLVCKKQIKNPEFTQDSKQQIWFGYIKNAVLNNVMGRANPKV